MTSSRQYSRSRLLPILMAVTALGFAACSVGAESTGDSTTTIPPVTTSTTAAPVATTTVETTTTIVPSTTEAPAVEVDTIVWTRCGRLECGTVDVPVAYDQPTSETISIAVNKRPASSPDDRIGYLLVNPGGPGDPGLGIVMDAERFWSEPVLDRFDIIGFDPRGIGESEPTLSCGSEDELAAITDEFEGEYGSPEYIELGERVLALCSERSGLALGRVHAEHVARDMDEIRKALGTEQISFHGLSWGTDIGVWYATLFPEHTRAMVIDAALNPTQIGATRVEMQKAYDDWLGQALGACESTCPIYNDGDPIGFYRDAAEKFGLVANALGEDGSVWKALVEPLYSAQSYPAFWEAIYELGENDDPRPFVELGSRSTGEEPSAEELALIEKNGWTQASANCVDEFMLHPEVTRDYLLNDPEIELPLLDIAFDAANRALIEASEEEPGAPFNFCAFLRPYAPESFTGTFDGSDIPIIVVANAFEGPIPYGQSKTLATDVLADGYLVDVVESDRHVVYPTNACVVAIVDAHLIDLDLPERTTTCETDEAVGAADDQTTNAVKSECISRVAAAMDGDAPSDDVVEFVCDELVAKALVEQGPAGLADGDLLDRLLAESIDQAATLDTPEKLTNAFCLSLLRDEVEPQMGPIPVERAQSICDTIIERALAEGGPAIFEGDQDDDLQRIYGEVINEEFGG